MQKVEMIYKITNKNNKTLYRRLSEYKINIKNRLKVALNS